MNLIVSTAYVKIMEIIHERGKCKQYIITINWYIIKYGKRLGSLTHNHNFHQHSFNRYFVAFQKFERNVMKI